MHRLSFKNIASIVFYLSLIIFLTIYLKKLDFSNVELNTLSVPYLLTGSVLALAFRYWGAFTWYKLLRSLTIKPIEFSRKLIWIYAKAWLGRYIPGKIAWIVARIHFGQKLGIGKVELATSSSYESITQVLINIIIASVFLVANDKIDFPEINLTFYLVIPLVLGCLLIIPSIFNHLTSKALRLFLKSEKSTAKKISPQDTRSVALKHALGSLFSGASYFFLTASITGDLDFANFLYIIGTFNLAGAIGTAAVFAPSGIGVREGIQVIFLSQIVPLEIALIISLFARIWSTAIDISFFFLAYLLAPTS